MIQSVGLARLIIPAYSISSKILPLVWRQPMEILPCPGKSAHLAVCGFVFFSNSHKLYASSSKINNNAARVGCFDYLIRLARGARSLIQVVGVRVRLLFVDKH